MGREVKNQGVFIATSKDVAPFRNIAFQTVKEVDENLRDLGEGVAFEAIGWEEQLPDLVPSPYPHQALLRQSSSLKDNDICVSIISPWHIGFGTLEEIYHHAHSLNAHILTYFLEEKKKPERSAVTPLEMFDRHLVDRLKVVLEKMGFYREVKLNGNGQISSGEHDSHEKAGDRNKYLSKDRVALKDFERLLRKNLFQRAAEVLKGVEHTNISCHGYKFNPNLPSVIQSMVDQNVPRDEMMRDMTHKLIEEWEKQLDIKPTEVMPNPQKSKHQDVGQVLAHLARGEGDGHDQHKYLRD